MLDSTVSKAGHVARSGLARDCATCVVAIHEDADLVGHLGAPKDPTHLWMLDEVATDSPEQSHRTLVGLLHKPRQRFASLSQIRPILS